MARGAAPPLNPEALKDARLGAGLSQAALARAAGTDRRQIIRYEQGAERPEIARLAALARACSVTVADLVDEADLPPGLAGLRVGAGMTMAAAAAALTDRLQEDVATNRASLSYAEKGKLPLSWRPPSAGVRVRGAMADAYGAPFEAVNRAWQTTFDGQGESGSKNPPSNEGATQTPPPSPHPYPSLAESAIEVWGSNRLASQEWHIRARLREADGSEVEAVATGAEGYEPVVAWWSCERGLSRTVYGEVVQALEWASPWRSMPDVTPNLPGAGREPAPGEAELPFEGEQPQESEPRLELLSQQEVTSFELDASRMYRVHQAGRLVGFVWRDADSGLWCGARAGQDGSLGLVASLGSRGGRTRRSLVEHLLDPTSAYIGAATPAAAEDAPK